MPHTALLLLLILIIIPKQPLQATDLTTISGNSTTLTAQLQSPKTLILIVSDEQQISEAQRLLTLAAAQQLHTLILIVLPDNQPLKAIAIRQAAKRFFKSDYSRSHIHFIDTENIPHPSAKSLLLAPAQENPIWQSPTFPSNADFDTAPFQAERNT